MEEFAQLVDCFHDMVAIKPMPPDTVTEGGIIIPDSVQSRMNKGTIVGMGEALTEKKAKVGWVVLHVKGAGTMIEIEKEEYWIMRYGDLLCKA